MKPCCFKVGGQVAQTESMRT